MPLDPYRYDCVAHSFAQTIANLVSRADNQGRLIVAWSEHDINQIKEAGISRNLAKRVDKRYRNAKETVRKWGQACHPEWEFPRDKSGRAHRLIAYLDRIGYPVPDEHRGGTVGQSIKSIRGALDDGKTWAQMTERQRERWVALLAHNVCDLDGMRAVTELAARGLTTGTPMVGWEESIGIWSRGGVK